MAQPEWQTCTNCQQSVPADAAVCGFCGHRLKVPAAEQPTLVQPVAPPPVVEAPPASTPIAQVPEPERQSLPAARALGAIGAVLVILSPVLPWLTISAPRTHTGFDIARSDLIPGDRFPGDGLTLESVGLAVLVLGLLALWWALTSKPSWLGWVAGLATLVIAVGVAVQVVRTIGEDIVGSLDYLDLGLYGALLGGILLMVGGLARQGR